MTLHLLRHSYFCSCCADDTATVLATAMVVAIAVVGSTVLMILQLFMPLLLC